MMPQEGRRGQDWLRQTGSERHLASECLVACISWRVSRKQRRGTLSFRPAPHEIRFTKNRLPGEFATNCH